MSPQVDGQEAFRASLWMCTGERMQIKVNNVCANKESGLYYTLHVKREAILIYSLENNNVLPLDSNT